MQVRKLVKFSTSHVFILWQNSVHYGRLDLLQVPLEVVTPLDSRKLNGMQLSLSGEHQFTNAGLAVALCRSWIQITGNWERLFPHVGELYYFPIWMIFR